MSDIVDEIKARLSIENLVSEYVVLKKTGKTLKGLCPFHSEKTPSFVVSPDKGIAYCFGCNKGGDIFKFFMELEGIEFSEALSLLAQKAGVEVQKDNVKQFVKKSEKDIIYEINKVVTEIYVNNLKTEKGKKVLEYLHSRGLNDETIEQFHLGYADDSYDETNRMLINKGFHKKDIVRSGLAMAKDTSLNNIYDRFRGRLMFPVRDSLGRVVGFGGRALQKDQQPKYLNSPETDVYKKQQLLYGFSIAKPFIKSSKQAVIVEGYMDFLMAFQDGLKNAVAVNGTAMTKRHILLLKPYLDEIVLSFDMDSAGQEAAKRSYELASEFAFVVKVLALPSGKDIAEFVKNSPGELQKLMEKIELYSDYLYSQIFKKFDKNSVNDKRLILQEFTSLIASMSSSFERDQYVRKLAKEMNVSEIKIYDELQILKFSKDHPAREIFEETKKGKYLPEDILIGLLVSYPKCFIDMKVDLSQAFFSEKVKTIYNRFLSIYNPQGNLKDIDPGALREVFAVLGDEMMEKISLMSLYVEETYGDMREDVIKNEILSLSNKVRVDSESDKRAVLNNRLKEAEDKQNSQAMEEILMEISKMSSLNNDNPED